MVESQSVGMDIRPVLLTMPTVEGLLEGCDSTNVLPSELITQFFNFVEKLAEPFERWLHQQLQQKQGETVHSPPVCIISNVMMLWTADR